MKKLTTICASVLISTHLYAAASFGQNALSSSDDKEQDLATNINQANDNSLWHGFSIGANVGSLGVGFNLAYPLDKQFLDLRFNANYLQYTASIENNPYAINMNSYGLLLDYKPFGGVFRVSTGLYYNNNNLQLNAGQTLSLNGQSYDTSQISNASSSVTVNPFSPYLGIGFNSSNLYNHDGGLYFSGDIGVLYQNPTVSLSATCISGSNMDCTDFDTNLNDEKNNIQNQLNSYARFYPVLNFMFGYRF